MKSSPVYLALGSNINAKKNIKRALKKLAQIGQIKKVSSFIKTKPVGFLKQPDFLNGALLIKTTYQPQKLLEKLKEIETELGRKKTIKNGPRTIDIDIIFYANLVLNTKNLKIPHTRMQQRIFVLKPLAEIAQKKVHPTLKKCVCTLLKQIEFK